MPHGSASKLPALDPSVPESEACKVAVVGPQNQRRLVCARVCAQPSRCPLPPFPVHHQLCHVFRPVGVTLPVLIITYKTVRVNFMASILSLQGSGAAHKLS